MADFCKQCSILMFGEDYHDLTHDALEGGEKFGAVCEGCGFTHVDHDGKCLDHTDKQHEDAILRGIPPTKG